MGAQSHALGALVDGRPTGAVPTGRTPHDRSRIPGTLASSSAMTEPTVPGATS